MALHRPCTAPHLSLMVWLHGLCRSCVSPCAEHSHVVAPVLVHTAQFVGAHLEPADFLIDVCVAERVLHEAVAPYHYRNLDEFERFAGVNTTMEGKLWCARVN